MRGIRKRPAERIPEASGSVFAVMAHLSPSNPKTAAIYTRRVDRARLAETAALRAHGGAIAQVFHTTGCVGHLHTQGTKIMGKSVRRGSP